MFNIEGKFEMNKGQFLQYTDQAAPTLEASFLDTDSLG